MVSASYQIPTIYKQQEGVYKDENTSIFNDNIFDFITENAKTAEGFLDTPKKSEQKGNKQPSRIVTLPSPIRIGKIHVGDKHKNQGVFINSNNHTNTNTQVNVGNHSQNNRKEEEERNRGTDAMIGIAAAATAGVALFQTGKAIKATFENKDLTDDAKQISKDMKKLTKKELPNHPHVKQIASLAEKSTALFEIISFNNMIKLAIAVTIAAGSAIVVAGAVIGTTPVILIGVGIAGVGAMGLCIKLGVGEVDSKKQTKLAKEIASLAQQLLSAKDKYCRSDSKIVEEHTNPTFVPMYVKTR